MYSNQQVPIAYATVVSDDHGTKVSHNTTVMVEPSAPPSSNPSHYLDEGYTREFLSEHKWPVGLQDTFIKNVSTIAFRFFICDDSGSMSTSDGRNIIGGPHENNKR